jgi:hypothetical protein
MSDNRDQRPDFSTAVQEWRILLQQRGHPVELLWLFSDNICFEPDSAGLPKDPPAFQIKFTPPPDYAAEDAYVYYVGLNSRLVFYRIGSHKGKSVCLLLCDDWFKSRGEPEGFVVRPTGNMSFRPGPATELEEVTDFQRWRRRLIKPRPLHDLDFCMDLKGVHEILAHGRVLTAYEHYALRFLHAWTRFLRR